MDPEDRYIDNQKTLIDLIKHITTLNTGSIVLLATFIEKVFTDTNYMWLASAAVICFMLSIVFLISCGFAIFQSIRVAKTIILPSNAHTNLITFTFLTFVLGMISFVLALALLTSFTIYNLQVIQYGNNTGY